MNTRYRLLYNFIVSLLICAMPFFIISPSVDAALGEGLGIAEDEPLYIKAESLTFLAKHNMFVAEGTVEITYREIHLTADRIEFNQLTGDTIAIGNVRYEEGGESIVAERTELNLDSELGTILTGKLSLEGDHYITGREIEKINEDTYLVYSGSYTACSSDRPAWSFRCTSAKVQQGEYLQAWNTVGYIRGIPIMYLPYFVFPMKTERQSGFLVPHIGKSSDKGMRMTNTYFWAISQGQDMTFTHNYYEKRGHRFDLEYRYLFGKDAEGTLLGKYFPDKESEETQRRLSWDHRQTLPYDIKSIINMELTSNDTFDRNFESDLSDQTQRVLGSTVSFKKTFSQHTLRLLFDREDNLREENSEQAKQRFPELKFSSQFPGILGTPLNISQETALAHLEEEGNNPKRFERLNTFANIVLPITIIDQALTLNPSLNGRVTYYSRDATTAEHYDRPAEPVHQQYYDVGISMNGPTLNRIFELGQTYRIRRIKHLIEPALSLKYQPAVATVNVPKFDGIDFRSSARSRSLSYGITHRLLAKRVTAADWTRFQDEEEDVTLEELKTEVQEIASLAINQSYNFEADRRKFSDISLKFSTTPLEAYTLTMNATYDVYVESFVKNNFSVQAKLWKIWNVGAQWDRTAVVKTDTDDITDIRRFLTLNTQLNLFDSLSLTYQGQMNVENGKRIKDAFGLTYDAQCWNVRGNYVQQLLNDERQDSFNIMLDFKNLGQLFDIKG